MEAVAELVDEVVEQPHVELGDEPVDQLLPVRMHGVLDNPYLALKLAITNVELFICVQHKDFELILRTSSQVVVLAQHLVNKQVFVLRPFAQVMVTFLDI